jgi:hypothetical protein
LIGWGGEDDELYKRVQTVSKILFSLTFGNFFVFVSQVQLNIASPSTGSIYDMEEMDLKMKINFLKEHELLKCMNRNELLDEHESSWKSNGISQFKTSPQFKVIQREYIGNDFCVIYTVNLSLNGGHWSDAVCGENDLQYQK